MRHKPETIGLILDDNGWADTAELIGKMNENGFRVTLDILDHVVITNNKNRFSFNESKTKIRANQGHSLNVDLNLKEARPPQYLYHGTGEKSVNAILSEGINKRSRQHVHLSGNKETAIAVGQRHGKPRIFIIESGLMQIEGFKFYLSDNNVWLTHDVPVKYLFETNLRSIGLDAL